MGGFATSQIIFIHELGTGIATGVLVDATVVRAFLVPSLMALLAGGTGGRCGGCGGCIAGRAYRKDQQPAPITRVEFSRRMRGRGIVGWPQHGVNLGLESSLLLVS